MARERIGDEVPQAVGEAASGQQGPQDDDPHVHQEGPRRRRVRRRRHRRQVRDAWSRAWSTRPPRARRCTRTPLRAASRASSKRLKDAAGRRGPGLIRRLMDAMTRGGRTTARRAWWPPSTRPTSAPPRGRSPTSGWAVCGSWRRAARSTRRPTPSPSTAAPVLDAAVTVATLDEALADRERGGRDLRAPPAAPRPRLRRPRGRCCRRSSAAARRWSFGPEESGLDNDALDRCQAGRDRADGGARPRSTWRRRSSCSGTLWHRTASGGSRPTVRRRGAVARAPPTRRPRPLERRPAERGPGRGHAAGSCARSCAASATSDAARETAVMRKYRALLGRASIPTRTR